MRLILNNNNITDMDRIKYTQIWFLLNKDREYISECDNIKNLTKMMRMKYTFIIANTSC